MDDDGDEEVEEDAGQVLDSVGVERLDDGRLVAGLVGGDVVVDGDEQRGKRSGDLSPWKTGEEEKKKEQLYFTNGAVRINYRGHHWDEA